MEWSTCPAICGDKFSADGVMMNKRKADAHCAPAFLLVGVKMKKDSAPYTLNE